VLERLLDNVKIVLVKVTMVAEKGDGASSA